MRAQEHRAPATPPPAHATSDKGNQSAARADPSLAQVDRWRADHRPYTPFVTSHCGKPSSRRAPPDGNQAARSPRPAEAGLDI